MFLIYIFVNIYRIMYATSASICYRALDAAKLQRKCLLSSVINYILFRIQLQVSNLHVQNGQYTLVGQIPSFTIGYLLNQMYGYLFIRKLCTYDEMEVKTDTQQ